MAGMDPMRFLESEDRVEVMVMHMLAVKWVDRRQRLDRGLAIYIIEELSKAMKK